MRKLILALFLLIAGIAAAIWLLAPDRTGPGLVSGADILTGGSIGIEQAGQGIAYGTHGQRLDIWRPSGSANGHRPVVIFFHGGAWRTGSRPAYAFAGRALARMGYVVIVPDYRKAPVATFPAFMEDAAQALAWTHSQAASIGGDPDRIALLGQSAGAHIAMLLALDQRYGAREKLPVNVVKAVVGISGPYDFYPFTDDDTRAVFGASVPEDNQPVHFARADAPPVLLIASRADQRIEIRNSVAMTDALHARGAHAQLMLVDGLSHEGTLLSLMPQLAWRGPIRARVEGYLAQTLHP